MIRSFPLTFVLSPRERKLEVCTLILTKESIIDQTHFPKISSPSLLSKAGKRYQEGNSSYVKGGERDFRKVLQSFPDSYVCSIMD